MTGNYLITTDNWFIAPDGKQYRAVWGNINIVDDSILGLKTNRMSTNWFAKIGSEDNHVIVAGCQIHYAVKHKAKPHSGLVKDYSIESGNYKEYERPVSIYVAE